MDPPGLTSLPTELVHQLCRLLPMEDVESVSNSCVRLYDTLNDNRVWERFLDNKARGLESESQHLEPAFVPDPALCGNRKHLARQQHLLQNLRAKRFVRHEVDDGKICMGARIYYKENYIILLRSKLMLIWDAESSPVLYCTLYLPTYMGFMTGEEDMMVVGDNLVFVRSNRIFVYTIDTKLKILAFRFSMIYKEDRIAYEISPINEVKSATADDLEEDSEDEYFRDEDDDWPFYSLGNYLVCQEGINGPSWKLTLHVWDLDNARKVGVFQSPSTESSIHYYTTSGNDMYFVTLEYEEYLKFNAISKTFSVFKADELKTSSLTLFYKDHCIIISDEHRRLKGLVFNFETSEKLVERSLPLMMRNELLNSDDNSIVGDKLVLTFQDSFVVTEPLTFETLTVIPCDFPMSHVITQVSLFGSIYVMAVGFDECLRMWDMNKKSSFVISQCDLDWHVVESELLSKVVLVDEALRKLTIVHFW